MLPVSLHFRLVAYPVFTPLQFWRCYPLHRWGWCCYLDTYRRRTFTSTETKLSRFRVLPPFPIDLLSAGVTLSDFSLARQRAALPWLSWVTLLTDKILLDHDLISVFWSLRTFLTSPQREAVKMRFCNLKTYLSAWRQLIAFHPSVFVAQSELGLFITNYTFSLITFAVYVCISWALPHPFFGITCYFRLGIGFLNHPILSQLVAWQPTSTIDLMRSIQKGYFVPTIH